MKNLVFIALLVIGTIQNSYGQCAIVYSSSDDVLAYAYRGKDDDPITKEECEAKANVDCKSRGGSNCKTIYTGDKLVGLWYPIGVAAISLVIGAIYIPSKPRETAFDN